MQQPNWFIGFVVPHEGWFDALERTPVGARYFNREDLHVTLSFLGAVEEADAMRAWQVATRFEHEAFSFPLGHIEPMGPAHAPTAWAVVPRQPILELNTFLATRRNLLASAAYARPDSRPPRPHITVARPKRLASAKQRAELERWAESQNVPQISVTLDQIALYTWSQERDHRLFRIVARHRIAPA